MSSQRRDPPNAIGVGQENVVGSHRIPLENAPSKNNQKSLTAILQRPRLKALPLIDQVTTFMWKSGLGWHG
jgi:hypothetical protein